MFIKQVDKLTKVLIDRKIITVDNREIVNYGLSTGVELILNIITTLVIGLIFDMVLESIVFVLPFASIRVYAGGYHLRKVLNCYFISNGIVVLVLLTVKMTPKEYLGSISFILLAISIPIILKFAPIGTANKPLSNYEKECFRKNFKPLGTYVNHCTFVITY
jgi:accessory gene regulator B